jgi:hypothetical protein
MKEKDMNQVFFDFKIVKKMANPPTLTKIVFIQRILAFVPMFDNNKPRRMQFPNFAAVCSSWREAIIEFDAAVPSVRFEIEHRSYSPIYLFPRVAHIPWIVYLFIRAGGSIEIGTEKHLQLFTSLPSEIKSQVEGVTLCDDMRTANEVSAAIEHFPFIKKLRASRFVMTDDTLKDITTKLPRLQVLDLSSCTLLDSSFEHFAKMKDTNSLIELDLFRTNTFDSNLAHIAQLSGTLEKLSLVGTHVTNRGFVYVGELTKLKQLSLQNTQIGDEGMKHLKNLTSLKVLSLKNTNVGDEGLEVICNFRLLVRLNLNNTKITNTGMHHLSGHPSIQSLFLFQTQIGDSSMLHISSLSETLTHLIIGYTNVTETGLSYLADMKKLKVLNMAKLNGITDQGLMHLSKLPHLEDLDLDENEKLTDAAIKYLLMNTNLSTAAAGCVFFPPQISASINEEFNRLKTKQ